MRRCQSIMKTVYASSGKVDMKIVRLKNNEEQMEVVAIKRNMPKEVMIQYNN